METGLENLKEMCIEANLHLSADMETVIHKAKEEEDSVLGKQILGQLCENMQIAGEDKIPICQDTGMAIVFVKLGNHDLNENDIADLEMSIDYANLFMMGRIPQITERYLGMDLIASASSDEDKKALETVRKFYSNPEE